MWRSTKFPLVIAALAFLLPWISVGLLGRPIAEASGWNLATGHIRSQVGSMAIDLGNTSLNYYVAAAAGLIILGLIASLLRRRLAVVVVIASLLAMALIWAGVSQYSEARLAAAIADKGDALTTLAASAIQVNWHIGYWVAMVALGIAAALAFLAIREPDVRR